MRLAYAHKYRGNYESLEHHLSRASCLAREFAGEFACGKVGEQIGRMHDVAKATELFQAVLRNVITGIDHAMPSGIAYWIRSSKYCQDQMVRFAITCAIMGHHWHLYPSIKKSDFAQYFNENLLKNNFPDSPDKNKKSAAESFEKLKKLADWAESQGYFITLNPSDYPDFSKMTRNELMLWIRMLESCQVDADYTATAEFMFPGYMDDFERKFKVDEFLEKLHQYREDLKRNAKPQPMNILREQVYNDCKTYTERKLYTLTAPTGTAKTIASLRAALHIAKHNGLRRVIVVLPYLSLIDQTCEIYKAIFGEENVLVDTSQTELDDKSRVFAERWSAPFIITTNVNFFQTLFASKASELRKLHNIVNSVIIYDEYQTLRPGAAKLSMELMQELVDRYGCSVILSTATDPHFANANDTGSQAAGMTSFFEWKPTEMIRDVRKLFDDYQKIKKLKMHAIRKKCSYEDVLHLAEGKNQFLCVLNTKRKARKMYKLFRDKFGEENTFLLYGNYCACDKIYIVNTVKERLRKGLPTYLIATQCIEAGVDLDFQYGAREYSPLDSMVQASGRVCRSALFAGEFWMFKLEDDSKYGYPSTDYQNCSSRSIQLVDSGEKLFDTVTTDKYFTQIYQMDRDMTFEETLKDCIGILDFKGVSDNFKIIEEREQSIFVVRPIDPDGQNVFDALMTKIQADGYVVSKRMMRRLSKFTVASNIAEPQRHGIQLFVHSKEFPINWYILTDGSYSDCGLIF